MIIKRIPAGVYAANCYILTDEATKECAVIDPGGDSEDLMEYIDSINGIVKHILLTHGHADHTGAAGSLMKAYKVPVHINEEDGKLITNGEFMFGPLKHKGELVELTNDISEGKVFQIGELAIKCIETPGHTPGGVCFLADKNLFTGDTLFLRSIGRTDLTGGNFDTLITSIKTKLFVLDEDITVFPGHGPQTTIKFEKGHNPFI